MSHDPQSASRSILDRPTQIEEMSNESTELIPDINFVCPRGSPKFQQDFQPITRNCQNDIQPSVE